MNQPDAIQPASHLKETLIRFLQENQGVFLKLAGSRGVADSVNGIHQLRVATKRLRSIFRWMEWVLPEKFHARRELRDVRKFFKVAGQMREIHLREKMLDGFCDRLGLTFPRYANVLREARWEAKRELGKRLPKFDPESLIKANKHLVDLLKDMDEAQLLESASNLVRQRMEEIKLLLPPGEDSERYHKIRILLKENLYVMQQVNRATEKPFFEPDWVDMVKSAGEKGGEWHDLDVFHLNLGEAQARTGNLFSDPDSFQRLRDVVASEERKAFKKYRKQVAKVLLASPFN